MFFNLAVAGVSSSLLSLCHFHEAPRRQLYSLHNIVVGTHCCSTRIHITRNKAIDSVVRTFVKH